MTRDRGFRRVRVPLVRAGSTPRRRVVGGAFAGIVLVLAAPLAATPSPARDAAAPVERLHAALLDAAAEGETARARYAHLHPVVSDVFDFQAMSRAAVGRVWSDFTADERAALVTHFADYATANYANNFDDARNISFRTVAIEPGRGRWVQVETELVRVEAAPISFDYLVFDGEDGARILNVVVADTMNEFERRRAEFRALLAEGGLSELLETLARRKRALVG